MTFLLWGSLYFVDYFAHIISSVSYNRPRASYMRKPTLTLGPEQCSLQYSLQAEALRLTQTFCPVTTPHLHPEPKEGGGGSFRDVQQRNFAIPMKVLRRLGTQFSFP